MDKNSMKANEHISVKMNIRNTGQMAGEEVVQLYIRDKVAAVVRPVKELKDFQKIYLKPGETKTIEFRIDRNKLAFYNSKLEWITEPGEFDLMIGASSQDIRLESKFELKKN